MSEQGMSEQSLSEQRRSEPAVLRPAPGVSPPDPQDICTSMKAGGSHV